MKLAFIGGGTMAEAMIAGVLSKGLAASQDISVGELLEDRRRLLEERYGVCATFSNPDAAITGDLVVLSVKPQDLPQVLGQLNGAFAASRGSFPS